MSLSFSCEQKSATQPSDALFFSSKPSSSVSSLASTKASEWSVLDAAVPMPSSSIKPTGTMASIQSLAKFAPKIPQGTPKGYTWKPMFPIDGHYVWNLNKDLDDQILSLSIRDCRNPHMTLNATQEGYEPLCNEEITDKWKLYPVKRIANRSIALRVGTMRVMVHVFNQTSPFAKDDALEKFLNTIDLVALAKL